jgi:beta-glucosidase
MSGEAASRAHLGLPGAQAALAEAVIGQARAQGTPVIAVLFAGRPLAVPWLAERADALLAAFFPGSEAGHAVVDVLTGQVSPAGSTMVSWPRATGQVPVFFAQRPSGRPQGVPGAGPYTSGYLDVPNDPLFAFGHGLTYGHFVLSDLRVSPATVRRDETLEVSVELLNAGPRAATATVFVFTCDKLASVARPQLELHAAGHLTLSPGERRRLTLSIPAAQLTLLGPELEPRFEPGELEVLVGQSAQRTGLLGGTVQLLPAGAVR